MNMKIIFLQLREVKIMKQSLKFGFLVVIAVLLSMSGIA